jgi:hypothetical protein
LKYQYEQWRQWAEWKSRTDYTGSVPFDQLDAHTRQRLVNTVAAETMPKQAISLLVEACAKASRSEDEFIRRIRREGLHIDPRLRKGVKKGEFDKPSQVVGYSITWRSKDGWRERFNAFDLGADLTLKQLRTTWAHNEKNDRLAVLEWQAAMNNRKPIMHVGREKQSNVLTAHDMSRLIGQAFTLQHQIEHADLLSGEEQAAVWSQALKQFDRLQADYGLTMVNSLNMELSMPDQQSHGSGITR